MYLYSVPALRLERRAGPGAPPFREFRVRHLEVDRARLAVDGDPVPVAGQGDGAAVDGLGGDVADDEAVAAAGEAAVGDEGDVVEHAGAGQGAGGGEHLGHAGAALGALVADDDDIPLLDAALLEALDHRLLGVEHAGGAGELRALLAGDLGDAAAGGERAAQDADVADALERFVQRVDDVLLPGPWP